MQGISSAITLGYLEAPCYIPAKNRLGLIAAVGHLSGSNLGTASRECRQREHNPHWQGLILPIIGSETISSGRLNKGERLRQRSVRASSSYEERAAQARVADAGPIENLPVLDVL